MRYSQRLKESILKKVLPPENKSVAEVSREAGIATKERAGQDLLLHILGPGCWEGGRSRSLWNDQVE